MTRPWLIGVTGNIACGKSSVMQRLAELGATTIDGDLVYRQLTGPGSELVQTLASHFGEQIALPDGSLDRPALGQIVFSDPAALLELDHLTHPVILEEVFRQIAEATTAVVATDGIKLIESGLGDSCDEVWFVACSPEHQRARLIARNGSSPEEADRRIGAQPPTMEKLARADVVLENDGTLQDLRALVDTAWVESTRKRQDAGYLPSGYES